MGGGSSLKNFDFSLLKGQLSIGVNRAYEFFDPTIIYGMDARLWAWIEQEKFGALARERFTDYRHGYKLWMAMGNESYPDDFLVVRSAGESVFPSSLEDGLGNGNNSGYGALNLAYALGADPIYLLGFDMRGDGVGGQSWFHSGYPLQQQERVYEHFRDKISTVAAPALEAAGRRVYHFNNDTSRLDCFPNVTSVEGRRPPVVIAYYTEGTGYEQYARQLEESLRPWGLERDIRPVPNLGSWQKNTQYKPRFILDMMEAHPGRSLLYLDVDATVDEYPRLFCGDLNSADIGVHYKGGDELLSGTIWLSCSDTCRDIIGMWVHVNKQRPDRWDQKNLQAVLDGYNNGNSHAVYRLPPEYCAIFDSMPEAGNKPVITHWQASRKLKGQVG